MGTLRCELNRPVRVKSSVQRGVAWHKGDIERCGVTDVLLPLLWVLHTDIRRHVSNCGRLPLPALRFFSLHLISAITNTSLLHPAWRTRTLYLKDEIRCCLGHVLQGSRDDCCLPGRGDLREQMARWKEDPLTVLCEKREEETVKVTSRIRRKAHSSLPHCCWFSSGPDLRRAEDSYLSNINCCPVHSPKDPERKGILSIS